MTKNKNFNKLRVKEQETNKSKIYFHMTIFKF